MANEHLKNVIPKFIYEVPDFSLVHKQMDLMIEESDKAMQEVRDEKYRYEQDVLQTLKNIESNTIGLNEIVPLLSKGMEKQDEMLEYLKEALSISASSSVEEAESKWRKLMTKANDLTKDVETIQKLTGFASTILEIYMKNR